MTWVLRGLSLGRFKAFNDTVSMPLTPLTLIIGKNGGGKSVITRLPVLLGGSMSGLPGPPIDLRAGGVAHAARYEDLVYQRSSLPFSIGATITNGETKYSFNASLIHVVELRALIISEIYFRSDSETFSARLADLNQAAVANPEYLVEFGSAQALRQPLSFRGLLPYMVDLHLSADHWMHSAIRAFEASLSQVSYLGPFRSTHTWSARVPRQGVASLGSQGENTLDFLGDDLLRTGDELVEEVKKWVVDSMGGTTLYMERSGDLVRLLLADPASATQVEITETGAGFTQVLPFVVQLLGRRSGKLPSPLVIVEQPELHLHPAAHGGVADLIVQATLARHTDTTFICETHSEQLISRIRRRVADGSLPRSLVSIVSVGHLADLDGPAESVRTISLDESGTPDAWPLGVFEESFNDLAEARAAAARR